MRLAVTICEDAWNDKNFWPRRLYTVDPMEELMRQQPAVHINLSSSPFWHGKRAIRRQMLAAIARRDGVPVLMSNQVGGNDSLIFDGSSLALNARGELIAQAASFEEDLVCARSVRCAGRAPQKTTTPRPPIARWCWARATTCASAASEGPGGPERRHRFRAGGGHCQRRARRGERHRGGHAKSLLFKRLHRRQPQTCRQPRIRFEVIGISGLFSEFTRALEPQFAGMKADTTEENIQSRIRGTLLMALSNKFSALVLTTGNKSEMAVGYCTLYGDMVGALAVIGDLVKTRVYAVCRWLNRNGEVIPAAILDKPPSAELRPDQKDTDSLPPYEVLDPILEAYVERYETPEMIAKANGFPLPLVQQVVRLVERSEYKRQQAAPVLKVTPKSFGMGRRFPIAVKVEG